MKADSRPASPVDLRPRQRVILDSDKFGELAEKVVGHFLGCWIDESAANLGELTADSRIDGEVELGPAGIIRRSLLRRLWRSAAPPQPSPEIV